MSSLNFNCQHAASNYNVSCLNSWLLCNKLNYFGFLFYLYKLVSRESRVANSHKQGKWVTLNFQIMTSLEHMCTCVCACVCKICYSKEKGNTCIIRPPSLGPQGCPNKENFIHWCASHLFISLFYHPVVNNTLQQKNVCEAKSCPDKRKGHDPPPACSSANEHQSESKRMPVNMEWAGGSIPSNWR